MKRTIGYQGIDGSNSRASAENMALRLGWVEVEYVPLISSQGVVDGMTSGLVQYGVMATHNRIAGTVVETDLALAGLSYTVLARDRIPIHHCLFVKDAGLTAPAQIASHIQALSQCREHLNERFPGAPWLEVEDTAIGARYLTDGTLPPDTGVLCRRDAGEAFSLHLLMENLEDNPENATDFVLIELGG